MNVRRIYLVTYNDELGEVEIQIWNDGKELALEIREVHFSGSNFDLLKPVRNYSPEMLKNFTLDNGIYLCNCQLKCDIPINLRTSKGVIETTLSIHLTLVKLIPPRGIDKEDLILMLHHNDKTIQSFSKSSWFEDELLYMQKKNYHKIHI